MCGITGILAFNEIGRFPMVNLAQATATLAQRGPDHQGTFVTDRYAAGHRRLSIFDLSAEAHQPMKDPTERYVLVFNGEIFNWRTLRQELEAKGVAFTTEGDTEVLMQLLVHEGKAALKRLNGFFAFAFFDTQKEYLLLARDRMGIKPLYYTYNEDRLIFGSEMKALLAFGLEKALDSVSLFTYLQLNYTPAPYTMLKGVQKLAPGHLVEVQQKIVNETCWYDPVGQSTFTLQSPTYEEQQQQLASLLDESVALRLAADVPVGSFLSGGIDSSVIAALAVKHAPQLHTFSIGYADEPYFDETHYARLVAKKLGTEHTVFSVKNKDLFECLSTVLSYFDEPFADSSALPVFLVSQMTRKHATVALSGDGADELFSGYNKHAAFYRMQHPGFKEKAVVALGSLWQALPKSRQNPLGNRIRQFARFAEGARLSPKERYWRWATLATAHEAVSLLGEDTQQGIAQEAYEMRRMHWLRHMNTGAVQEALETDTTLVLPDDMLTKVDRMSMANSLEVRVPFLDHRVVEFAFSLPEQFKINAGMRKRIVQDAFRHLLPPELYRRSKHGFEVPLLKWMQNELRPMIAEELLAPAFIKQQGIFSEKGVEQLLKQLFSQNPGDAHARVWALMSFQIWWKQHG